MLLNDYNVQDAECYEAVIANAVDHLPFTLSYPIRQQQQAVKDRRYGQAMNHLLDFFEISTPFCSFLFLRLLQGEMDTKPTIRPVLETFVNRIDQKRPLSFGDWQNDLLTPLMAAAQKSLEDHPLTKSFSAHIYVKRKNILLGSKSEPSIVQIRNEYRGHSTTLSEEIYAEVVRLLEPRMLHMLQALEPLCHCRYDIREGCYGIQGDHIDIDLFPLVFVNSKDYRYVFHTLKDEQACYLSSNENALSYISYDMNSAIDHDLQHIVPSFDIAKDLNWNEIRQYMQRQSAIYLQRVYAEKKYNQELFVERQQLTDVLHRFWESSSTLFPLVGEAGQGKTNQLSYWTEQLIATDEPVLIFNASDFVAATLDNTLKLLFGYNLRKDITRLTDNIHAKAEEAGHDVYIFFDALNECLKYADEDTSAEGPLALYQALCRIFINERYPRFKVLFTCRVFTWKNVVLPMVGEERILSFNTDSEDAKVRGFNQEETRRAYEIYQQLYQMHTPFSELDRRVGMVGDYLLDSYLRGEAIDGIAVAELKGALDDPSSALYPLASLIYKKDGISIAFAELLNKAERPILKEVARRTIRGEEHYIQFIYERYLEYVLSCAFLRRQQSNTINAQTFVDALHQGTNNVVFIGTMRNALLQHCLKTGSFDIIIELEAQWGEDYAVMSLVNESINTLITENYEDELFAFMNHIMEIQDDNETCILRLRKLAAVSIVNGILLTDYFNEQLYHHDALALLWKIMADPIYDVRNDACMYSYYLSNNHHTLEYTPLRENLTVRIVKEMYANIKRHNLIYNMVSKKARTLALFNIETASRLAVLMIIDSTLRRKKEGDDGIVSDMMAEIRSIFNYMTANLMLIRLFMPLFQIAMRRQVTFQSDYVNNAMEYQTFWQPDTFSNHEYQGCKWQPAMVKEAMSFCHHHARYGSDNSSAECKAEEERWRQLHPFVLSAYKTGDSFSLFVLERMMIIMGVSDWKNIEPIVTMFFSDEFRQTHWFDYCRMSMLYVLYQLASQKRIVNRQLLDIYAREAEEWTQTCRGLFIGRRSKEANATGKYKRNIMSWYAAVYVAYAGDGQTLEGDERAVPVFYQLIEKAFDDHDKELLIHLIENIQELIADMGYIQTALPLLKNILERLDTQATIDAIDAISLDRGGVYQYDIVKLIGNVLSTAKHYFPTEIDTFIQKEVVGLSFPGAKTYREDVLNYHPSGESLQDVLTHKFGNFLIYSLLNVEAIDDFAVEAIEASTSANNSFAWYEQCVRVLVKHLFNKKL